MVKVDHGSAGLDWDRLRHAVEVGIRFLDDAIEVNRDPLPQIAAATRGNRKIGLGAMGLAECLLRLGVPYDAEDALAWADRLAGFVAEVARNASRALARERGVFPNWSRSIHATNGDRIRDAACLSIAPTGTLSIIAGTTAGIEPLFALAYRREHTLGGELLIEDNPVILRYLEARRLDRPSLRRC